MIIPDKHKWTRWLLGISALVLMVVLFIFQHEWLWFQGLTIVNDYNYLPFVMNRSLRLILNDTFCLLLFLAIFNRTKELKLASTIFLIELFLVLPFYLIVKLTIEGDSEISTPLLSFIHRLIVNPLLMIILLVGLVYQRYRMSSHY
jgi:exosortase F-associated protein